MIETLEELHQAQEYRRRALERELESIRRQLVVLGASRLVLFGSLARGKVRRASDLDIIAVMPDTRSGREWMSEIYETLDRSVDCDILAFTPAELEAAAQSSRFIRHALSTGKVIHDS